MLNDLAIFKTEDIHYRRTAVAGFEDQVTMQDHVIAFRDDPFWFHAKLWKVLREPFHSLNKRFWTICCAGIVLTIVRPEIFGNRFFGLAYGEFMPFAYDFLVCFQLVVHRSSKKIFYCSTIMNLRTTFIIPWVME